MKAIHRSIVNELGNRIYFRIVTVADEVNVFANGPTSEVGHTWTRMEAKTLRAMLDEALTDE